MILLDTNVLSELMKSQPERQVLHWLDSQLETDLFISAISKAEIELGIALLPAGKRRDMLADSANLMFTQDFAQRILSFDGTAATLYAELVAQRISLGRPISVEDAQIAAIALRFDLLLATRNVKDFLHIEQIKLFNPWLPAQN